MTLDFTGKIVLVTGASRGIGRECAKQFAEHGAKVAVHYNSNRAAAEDTLRLLPGSGHIMVNGDMADANAVKQMVDSVAAEMGGLDVLVNNAGIYTEHPALEVDYEEWQRQWLQILQTNLIGAANAIFCAVPHMVKRGGGRVINVSSRGAFRGEATAPAYGASKAGMNSMGQSLAVALAPQNIFVATVAPGWVATDMAVEHLNAPGGDAIRNQSPLKRVAEPEEVAYAVLFLASPGAEFMTGAILDVNGASYLRT
ncbi:MAG TPA: SDR family oxidoreductase [Phototrophicaceae bacterium]|nr:SDR family oxidoreductase [Phototrophicaceae bacterium]